MALTESTMLPLGAPMPSFTLTDVVSDKEISSNDFSNQPVLVVFICNHCPYVIHIADTLASQAAEYAEQGIAVVAISSNDVSEYPADAPNKMKEEAVKRNYGFPYLYDASQDVAKNFSAACTPDFFLFNKEHQLFYRGRFDETRPTRIRSGVYESEQKPTGKELTEAIEALVQSAEAPEPQYPSLGCNIKWKSENA